MTNQRTPTWRPRRSGARGLWCLLALVLVGAAAPAWADYQERLQLTGESLEIGHLIGSVRIEGHTGTEFEVTVTVQGRDARPGVLELRSSTGGPARHDIQFPRDQFRYLYPAFDGRATLHPRREETTGASWLGQLLARLVERPIVVNHRGDGLELWADVVVKAPAGRKVTVEHGVGELSAQSFNGDLVLDVAAGGVRVESVRGDVQIDTGSGRVVVADVDGDLSVDTGSGSVELTRITGDRVSVDTGSGRVDGGQVAARELDVDTGSGSVVFRDSDLGSALIDTGSGGVEISLRTIGNGPYEVDTGSGGIRFQLPAGASAEVSADTGSGGITVDGEARFLHRERDTMRFVLGGGAAAVRLDTGSGSIRVGTV